MARGYAVILTPLIEWGCRYGFGFVYKTDNITYYPADNQRHKEIIAYSDQ